MDCRTVNLPGETGLAMLSDDQLDYQPLPGGGLDTGGWKVWSSVRHTDSIPVRVRYGIWRRWRYLDRKRGRLDAIRYRRRRQKDQRWFTYTPANSPLILNDVRSLAMDSHGNLWLTNVSRPVHSSGALFRFNPTSNVWTQYRVGQESPWTPPWYNVNAVIVGADDRVSL